MRALPKVLPIPEELPKGLESSAKWLAGEGAGSWFEIKTYQSTDIFEITRFSPTGKTECKGLFTATSQFEIEEPYQLAYPSHCRKVTVIQHGNTIGLCTI